MVGILVILRVGLVVGVVVGVVNNVPTSYVGVDGGDGVDKSPSPPSATLVGGDTGGDTGGTGNDGAGALGGDTGGTGNDGAGALGGDTGAGAGAGALSLIAGRLTLIKFAHPEGRGARLLLEVVGVRLLL